MNMFRRIIKSALLLITILVSVSAMGDTDSKTYDGYNLVAPNFHTTTYLVDMDGNVVHYWLNDGSPAISAYLLENGNLLRTSTVDQLEQTSAEQNPPGARGGSAPMRFPCSAAPWPPSRPICCGKRSRQRQRQSWLTPPPIQRAAS